MKKWRYTRATLSATALALALAVPTPGRAQVDTVQAQRPAAQEPGAQQEPAAQPGPERAPVVLRGRTLFYVQERVLSFTPEDRARTIAERLERIYKDPLSSVEPVSIEEGETSSDLLIGDRIVMSVTDRDARAAGRPRQELATELATLIDTTLQELHRQYSLTSLLLGAGYTALTLIALALIFFIFGKLFPKLYAKLDSWRDTRIPSLKIQRLTLATSSRLTDLLIWLAKAARVAATIVVLYFSLPLILGFFPWTRGYAAIIYRFIGTPLGAVARGFVAYLPNLFFIAVIILVTYYLIKFTKLIFNEIGKGTIALPGFYKGWARPTFKIVRFLIIAFTAIAIFPYLPGAGSDAFKGVSLFLGVLFSLGSTGAIANIVAGVVLTYTRAFDIGDRVKISDTVGDVTERTLLATYVRTTKNVDITVPNAMVLGSHIINYSTSARTGLILHTGVTIGYDVPWKQVHELLLAAARDTENVEEEPAPFVLQTSLDDFYVSYELNAYTDKPQMMAKIYSELHQNIQDKFNEAGVEIMSPHFSAVRDGHQINIPQDYLPKDYAAPAFRLNPLQNLVPKS